MLKSFQISQSLKACSVLHTSILLPPQLKKFMNESISRGIQTENLLKLINFNKKIQNNHPQLKVDKIQYFYLSSIPLSFFM